MATRETVEFVLKVSAGAAKAEVDAATKSVANLGVESKKAEASAKGLDTGLKDGDLHARARRAASGEQPLVANVRRRRRSGRGAVVGGAVLGAAGRRRGGERRRERGGVGGV